ncbi:hypothetical protein [Calidifontibacter terrae]
MSISTTLGRAAMGCGALALVLSGCESASKTTAASATTPTSVAPTAAATTSSAPSSAPTSASTPASTAASTSATCPASAVLLTAWDASPDPVAGVTGFTDITCWSHWVVGFPQGPGDGAIKFSSTPNLHVTTPAEAQQFGKDVCAATDAPADWKQDESIMVC